MTLGDTPSSSARTIVGVPCMSLPPTIRTPSPFIRWYRAMTSAGMNVETAWPRCLGPDAYGQATHTRIFISSVQDGRRSEEHTSELQSRGHLVCRLLFE